MAFIGISDEKVGSAQWQKTQITSEDHVNAAIVIVGAGFAGICQAINLLKEGIRDFILLERGGGFGGTWRDNIFPGASCDVWSHLYSFSFEINSEWTRAYPGQEEILEYLVGVASKHQLYEYARFNTEVVSAQWSDQKIKWEITVKTLSVQGTGPRDVYTISADYFVSATGQLSTPKFPIIEGISNFDGKLIHTARWDNSYSLEGKRVAVIGTGATAAQVVPEVAKAAGQLTVFQRSPTYVFPRQDHPISSWTRALIKHVPLAYKQYRARLMDVRESFHRMLTNKDNFQEFVLMATDKKMKSELPDRPDLWVKFRPNFKPGCKRPVISDAWYPTFMKSNVKLENGSIHSIKTQGISMTEKPSETLPFDVIICATGFDSLNFLGPIDLRTRSGESLKQKLWGPSPYSLRGISAPDCPNFSMLFGPNSGLSHNSLVLVIEAQSRVITRMINAVVQARRQGRSLALTPRTECLKRWNDHEQALLKQTTYLDPACTSWWKNAEGRVTNQYHGTAVDYQNEMSFVHWTEYEAFGTGSAVLQGKKDEYIGRVVEETQVNNSTIAVVISGLIFASLLSFYLAC